MRTFYRVCSRLPTATIPSVSLDTLLTARHHATFDSTHVTLRGDLCPSRHTAEMLLRAAQSEFPQAHHWLQTIRFEPASQAA